MRNYKNYNIWDLSHKLTLEVYKLSSEFPREEQFGLTSQLRRAVTSIGLNIVEGSARKSDKEFSRFLYISAGSAAEVEYIILILRDLNILNSEAASNLEQEFITLRKMIYRLIQSID